LLSSIPWRIVPDWLLGNRLRILMYHSIADNPHDPHAISVQRFRQQMATLAQGNYQVIALQDGLARIQARQPLKRCIVLTFDDAYRDFLTQALPVLEQFKFPATLFVPTGCLGGTAIWDSYDQRKPLMTWQELAEAQARGITIASHTVTVRAVVNGQNEAS